MTVQEFVPYWTSCECIALNLHGLFFKCLYVSRTSQCVDTVVVVTRWRIDSVPSYLSKSRSCRRKSMVSSQHRYVCVCVCVSFIPRFFFSFLFLFNKFQEVNLSTNKFLRNPNSFITSCSRRAGGSGISYVNVCVLCKMNFFIGLIFFPRILT